MGLKRFLLLVASVIVLSASSFAQTLPAGVQKVTSIEGVTEYAFPNGLHVLLFPDNSKPKITVNIVYLVGSRNEGYGETGMAHLLEHMTFKSPSPAVNFSKNLPTQAATTSMAQRPKTRRCTSRHSTPAMTTCAGRCSWNRTAWST